MTVKARICIVLLSVVSLVAVAEPWISNRYAQNCAGCHAPGRINRVPKDRRCTLSCQGCHTNPNGGGLRNDYGRWNSERWLRSNYSKNWKVNKPTPAPYSRQDYAKLLESHQLSSPKHKPIAKIEKNKAKKIIKKNAKVILAKGPELKIVNKNRVSEKIYDKYNDTRWKLDNRSKVLDLASVTKEDPLRLVRRNWFNPSFEARYFLISNSGHSNSDKNYKTLSLMAVDLGLELKPFQHNLKFVFEARYGNNPKNSQWDTGFNTGARTKSAYVLWDDLPYNTYVMYGIFRPMFGYYSPDHQSLAQMVSGLAYDGTVKGISLGAAPNVPFANLHIITPKAGVTNKESGMAVNLGARFVTLGASGVFSYWKTKVEGTTPYDRLMWSINLGGMYKRLVANFDLLRVEKNYASGKNGGNVSTFDFKYRLFKENYLLANLGVGNTARDLSKGSASEISFGYKTFVYSGVELEFMLVNLKEKTSSTTENTKRIQAQAHLFF